MKLKNFTLVFLVSLVSLATAGCGDEASVRQIALQLRAAIIEDEQLIDKNIEAQTAFYEKQRKTIDDSRSNNILFQLDGSRRMRSAEAATAMSLNPEEQARISNLMNYLLETNDKEYELWQQLYGDDQKAREDLKSKIAKLQRGKKVLTQVKENLHQLALAPNRKKRAKVLLQFSQETYAAFKNTSR